MSRFLIRSYNDPRGYKEATFPNAIQQREARWVPWAITQVGREVVYAKLEESRGWNRNNLLLPYDSLVSLRRREECESILSAYILEKVLKKFTERAVRLVSDCTLKYLSSRIFSEDHKKQIFNKVGHVLFDPRFRWFGRISNNSKYTVGAEGLWHKALEALEHGTLEQQLLLHHSVSEFLMRQYTSNAHYRTLAPIIRDEWFSDKKKRGRIISTPKDRWAPTDVIGIAPLNTPDIPRFTHDHAMHLRAADRFTRDLQRTHDPLGDAYYDEVDIRHLGFTGGISGATGHLLLTATSLAELLKDTELLMEYTLAIVGHLVGSGSHNYHEIMAVTSRVGIPYLPGQYKPSLPKGFLKSDEFKEWRAKFYDIVELGGTHWRFNLSALPSRLRSQPIPLPQKLRSKL